MMHKPDFIIIGAMKCATSTMHDQLDMQDGFFMTTPKEPFFFSDDDVYAKGNQWYSSLYEDAGSTQLKGESSTHYTKLPRYPNTIERIQSYCPDAKFIYMMRHPVDRLVSHYIHEWTQRVINCDIDHAVSEFNELIDFSRYNMQIEQYIDAFGVDAILPVFVERLKQDPIREMQAVFNFLKVDATPIWHEALRSNVSAERIRASKWRDAIVNNELVTRFRRKYIPKEIRNRIRNLWAMKKRPILSQHVLKQLEATFNQDLKLLGEKLGLQLNCEGFKDKVTSPKQINWVI